MERLNSGDSKIVFGTDLGILNIGVMKCGRGKWKEAEAKRKSFNIVLTDPLRQILYLRALLTKIHMSTELHVAHFRVRRGGGIRCMF